MADTRREAEFQVRRVATSQPGRSLAGTAERLVRRLVWDPIRDQYVGEAYHRRTVRPRGRDR